MALPEEIETRISAFEADVTRTLRNHGQLINGWGTQLNARLDDLEARVDTGFDEMRTSFTEVRGMLDGAAAGYDHVTKILTILIEKSGAANGDPDASEPQPPAN